MSFCEYINILSPERDELITLIAETNAHQLETMAQKAHCITKMNFGKTMQMFTPLYLSNFCDNSCLYCAFNANTKIKRHKLSDEEIKTEAEFIKKTGLKHILLLTGGSRSATPVGYIKNAVNILKKDFSSISLEIYPLETDEYKMLIDEGVDGLTIYQETYNKEVYAKMHPNGPKSDYKFRLDAPERALKAGMRTVNIGALLGLANWKEEVIATGLHAKYLQDTFSESEISISIPRMRPFKGVEIDLWPVRDKDIVRIIIVFRNFLPRVGITLSTREQADLREKLLPLGITKMSAGSTTKVGGHTANNEGEEQFSIADKRNVEEIIELLKAHDYQPILKDWA